MSRVALAIVCCLAGAGCAFGDESERRTFAEADLSELVLQQADLPRVFTRFDEGRQARADTPGGSRTDPRRFGRVDGWKARFRRPGTRETVGPLVIESRADLFESADGAADEFDAHLSDLEQEQESVEAPTLGDESFASTTVQGVPGAGVRFYLIAWREDNVVASLVCNGFEGKLKLDEVVRLARKQEARLAAAAGR